MKPTTTKQTGLTKAEIQHIRHALYMHREYSRSQERLARERGSVQAEGHSYAVSFSLKLDDKLSDMENHAAKATGGDK